MIQRIQSIYLLLAAIFSGLLFALPFGTSDSNSESGMLMDGKFNIMDHNVLLILTGLSILIAVVTIFLFKNRKLQTNISLLNILVILGMIIFGIVLFVQSPSTIQEAINPGLGIGLPILGIVCMLLARQRISKDEKLVKSMDRLR